MKMKMKTYAFSGSSFIILAASAVVKYLPASMRAIPFSSKAAMLIKR